MTPCPAETALAELLRDPSKVGAVEPSDALALLEQVAIQADMLRVVERGLVRRALAGTARPTGEERHIDLKTAAARLCVSRPWLYRHWSTIPCAKRIGRKVVFSEAGLGRWMASRSR